MSKPQTNVALDAVLKRLKSNIRVFDSPEALDAGPSLGEHQRKMMECGYPQRHVERLAERLHGPALEKARELSGRVVAGDCLMLLLGDRGPGKTQMATCWALDRLRAGKFCGRYVKLYDLLIDIKGTWHGKGSEETALDRYRRPGYLVIDEAHEMRGHEFEHQYLTNIIDHRYDDRKATVIIANLSRADAESNMPASVISRCNEIGGVIDCDWPSYRA